MKCRETDTAIDLGDQATASRYLRSTLETPAADEPALMAYFAEAAAILAIQGGDHARGLRLLGADRAALTRVGYRETPDEADRRRHWIAEGRRRLGVRPGARDARRRG